MKKKAILSVLIFFIVGLGESMSRGFYAKDQVPDGEYNIFIEVHLTDKFNELYSGIVEISRKKFSNQLQVSYRPEKYTRATNDVLSDVRISLNE